MLATNTYCLSLRPHPSTVMEIGTRIDLPEDARELCKCHLVEDAFFRRIILTENIRCRISHADMSMGAFFFCSILFAVTSSTDHPPLPREIGAYRWFFDQRGRCGRSFANPPASKRVEVDRCGCLFCHRSKLLFYSKQTVEANQRQKRQ